MENIKVATVILTYNETKFTQNLVKLLLDDIFSDYIIVVDNSDNDAFINSNRSIFSNLNPSVFYLKTPCNNGFAAGNNYALKYITENFKVDYIWIINNDIIPQKNAGQFLIKEIQANNNKAICGSILFYYNGKPTVDEHSIIQCYGGGTFYPYLAKSKLFMKGKNLSDLKNIGSVNLDFIIGASMMVPISLIKEVGYIPEEYFMYNEEMDWQTLAGKKGYKRIVAKDSHIIHMDGLSTKGKKYTYYFYINRSFIMYCKKYYKSLLIFAVASKIFEIIFFTPKIINKKYSFKGLYQGLIYK